MVVDKYFHETENSERMTHSIEEAGRSVENPKKLDAIISQELNHFRTKT